MVTHYDPETYPHEWNYLQPGTIIDRYIIERALAGGGFSSVYLARQLSNQHQVAIKEYLPRRLAHRTWGNRIIPHTEKTQPLFLRGKSKFLAEAKVLSKLKHPNIVEVLNFFSANDTAYLVMTYDYGKNLASYIKDKRGGLSGQFLLVVFTGLLGGIKVIHQHKLLHLDIKPENILIRPGGSPLLLDFGAVHPYPTSGRMKAGNVVTNGYSPIEQYVGGQCGDVGPWSDIYAVGATMRTCIDGNPPPPAPKRKRCDTLVPASKAFHRKYPQDLLEAIDAAMELQPAKRPQSVDDFMVLLKET
jgi:serine/threonine protein kinase